MSDKFLNKYRIPSARLQNWDYGSQAMYFITICTAHRECYFGEIIHGVMVLTEIGKIVETEWLKTFELRPDMNLGMCEFVIMPNHFHAIISIGENPYNAKKIKKNADGDADDNAECDTDGGADGGADGDTDRGADGRDAMHRVSTFGPQSKNLASIIRGFKSAVTINARKIHADFAWQSRFHDHIIRNDESFQRISKYIRNNPLKWADDKFRT